VCTCLIPRSYFFSKWRWSSTWIISNSPWDSLGLSSPLSVFDQLPADRWSNPQPIPSHPPICISYFVCLVLGIWYSWPFGDHLTHSPRLSPVEINKWTVQNWSEMGAWRRFGCPFWELRNRGTRSDCILINIEISEGYKREYDKRRQIDFRAIDRRHLAIVEWMNFAPRFPDTL